MLAIKSNIMSTNAARQLSTSYDALAKSVERLSSGLRINSAKDDAAGLAVRELMRADIAVLEQGARNAQDAISMVQTFEGAMAVIDESLVRMKQLAEQAATESYSATQRNIMNSEFDEMTDEIDRIAQSTEFNSISLLNSGAANLTIHFGSTQTISITAANMRAAGGLGIHSTTVSIATAASAQSALDIIGSAINYKDSARASFGYKMNRLESTARVLGIQTENLMAAESRISDVDVAIEMGNMTRNQVLAQAGVAMLAQANTMPQMALTLLR